VKVHIDILLGWKEKELYLPLALSALAMLRDKHVEIPAKKHDNLPL
jgi:hypothetical protein